MGRGKSRSNAVSSTGEAQNEKNNIIYSRKKINTGPGPNQRCNDGESENNNGKKYILNYNFRYRRLKLSLPPV